MSPKLGGTWSCGTNCHGPSTDRLLYHRPVVVRVETPDRVWEGRALQVAVTNTPSYGAGIPIAPGADIQDGELDVVVVEHVGRMQLLRHLPLVMRGAP